ncbi:hypothetical protein O7626_39740 [Micromonospora sp. WMMD1102]|uniref:zinc finger domain-containing protein n=1 Tax=Micromonospora sp. WMMD1102 TaxID=3016105 RepID=UPI002414DC9F|nr:hypothetical protein [Micromonospora sp. WMMD1102]MDG4791948.1 hypothetical protein [Micromonospora sp. WMMD1102]
MTATLPPRALADPDAVNRPDAEYRRTRAYYMAADAVKCPTCRAGFGSACKSTGGGNSAFAPTHKARTARIAGWTDEQRHKFGDAVWRYQRPSWNAPSMPVEEIERFAAEAEAAAAPIPVKVEKRLTPKGVRLSELQAEEIERAAHGGGKTSASTAHFHGDHQHRQTINALRDKGILAEGSVSGDGYAREYTLTLFGWRVYRQHRLIIRRLSDAQIDAFMAEQGCEVSA